MKPSTKASISTLLTRYPALSVCEPDLTAAVEALLATYRARGKLIICGHGASASDSEHVVGELMQGFLMSLGTAFANDQAPDLVFAQQILGMGNPEDTLLAISTSGNSTNVIYALDMARAKGLKTIALTGKSGGKIAEKHLAGITIRVPEDETYKIQELHLPVYHMLCIAAEEEFFGE